MAPAALSRQIADVARALQAETGPSDTMELAVKLAVEVVEGAEEASLSLVHRDLIVETPAATGDRAFAAARLQQELRSGPLLSGVWDREVLSASDLANESRWPQWASQVASELGFASMLCLRMFAAHQRLGAISVYSSEPDTFTGADVEAGISFAAHTAVAVEVGKLDEHKDLALDSRSLIGQATGILMERYDIDAVRAFAVLRRISQNSNVKLHEVATELIRTRIVR